jgi:metal-responsive CopG/Arc/MetJ family transcriptional regulator
VRTIVDLPDAQLRELGRLCEEQKISRAEAIRRAVGKLLKESASKRADERGFGIWRHKRINGRKYVEKIRSEWNDR